MKFLLIKYLVIPFAAYFSMMLTVAFLGSIIGNVKFRELTDGSGLTIWLGWMVIFFITITAHHFLKEEKKE